MAKITNAELLWQVVQWVNEDAPVVEGTGYYDQGGDADSTKSGIADVLSKARYCPCGKGIRMADRHMVDQCRAPGCDVGWIDRSDFDKLAPVLDQWSGT